MNIYLKKKFKQNLIMVLFLVATVALIMPWILTSSTNADEPQHTVTADYFSPKTELEYLGITSPTDVYFSDDLVAISQNQAITVYKNGQFLNASALTFTTLKQVKSLDENVLLVLDNAIIYTIDLQTGVKSELKDSNSQIISGNYFDFNGKYLVTAFGTSALVYEYQNGAFNKLSLTFSVKVDLPICINDNNEIIFVDDDGIFKINLPNTADRSRLSSDFPDKMIADNECIYYVLGNEIFSLSILDKTLTPLTFSAIDDKFELGRKINSPRGISFKGENLLISDTDTIQEFRINNDTLVFTGYAIADGKTAYNRVAKDAVDLEKQGETIAVLDSYKLTVITKNNADQYARENYTNFFNEDLGGTMPSAISLGENSILLCYNLGTSGSSLRILDLVSNSLSEEITISGSNVSRDIVYQSGNYYVLADNGSAPSKVYSFSEKQFTITDSLLVAQGTLTNGITVDVFGNVYLTNGTNVYKYSKSDNFTPPTAPLTSDTGIKKMITDLGGVLYVLTDSGMFGFDGTSLISVPIDMPTGNIKSFAMDFITSEVYMLLDGQESILTCSNLENITINSALVPSEFITTSENADLSSLKIYKPNDGANVYSVINDGVSFKFAELIKDRNEYVYVCQVNLSNQFGSVNLLALVGQNETVLINAQELTDVTPTMSDAPQTAFVTTGVNAYYLPLITKNAEYSLTDDSSIIRLIKATKISPLKIFTYLDKEYYFATVSLGEKTYSCYVPVAFTVEVLSENFKWDEYTVEKVHSADVYSDEQLTTKIATVKDGDSVRLIINENGVCLISFNTENGWVNGYVSSTAIKNDAQVAVRNSLIILAVAACVCGTTIFFVLKRKD